MFSSDGNGTGGTACLSFNGIKNTSTCFAGTNSANDNQNLTYGPVPAGGITIASLSALAGAALTGNSAVLTVLDNGSATALTCTVPVGGTTCADNTDTVFIPAGHFLQVRVVVGAGANNVAYQVTFT